MIQLCSNHLVTLYSLPDYIKKRKLDYVLISVIKYPTKNIQHSLKLTKENKNYQQYPK